VTLILILAFYSVEKKKLNVFVYSDVHRECLNVLLTIHVSLFDLCLDLYFFLFLFQLLF